MRYDGTELVSASLATCHIGVKKQNLKAIWLKSDVIIRKNIKPKGNEGHPAQQVTVNPGWVLGCVWLTTLSLLPVILA